jgi:hypothetical protein
MMPAAPGRATIAAVMPVPRPWLDWAIAGALTALGVFMTLGRDNPDGTIVDSIVVAAVTLPVAWRRSAPLVAAAALAPGVVVSGIPTFDQSRCGVAIPAALLILFSLAARRGLRQALGGLALVLGGMVALLLTDPLLDAGAVFILPLCAGVWWIGRLVRSRNRVAAELGALLAQARAAGAVVELRATGRRRALPAGIELAGYRMVQHALEALAAIDVTLRYLPDALELEIRGDMADGSAAEAALAAAHERITAHGGSFDRDRGAGGTCVLRGRLPIVTAGG